jgi:two-component system, NtrC family, sensor kinase
VAAKTKILLIDDNAVDRELIARLLGSQATVLEAASVADGLEVYRKERPDCVLLDHFMPGMAGLDALATFVQEKAVVIMITGAGSDQLAAEAFKRGARDYILKRSLTEAVLWRMINREIERRRLEHDLHESRERFDEIAARIPEVLWVRSLEGEFLYLSPSFEQIWGRPRTGMTRQLWDSALHPDDRGGTEAAELSWTTGQEYELVFRIVRPDGQARTISSRGYPILEGGRLARVGGIARDVTEENRMSQQLRLAQKLEAIGQLAAGVAHEINTPAQYVSDNITFLAEGFREVLPLLDACSELAKKGTAGVEVNVLCELAKAADLDYLVKEVPSAIQQSAAGIAQIKKIVQAMKEFSHPSDEMQMVNLNRSIESTVTVAKNEWKYVADVNLELAEDLPFVSCHPSEVNQVILNLVVNAAHAIGDVVKADKGSKGVITVGTRVDGTDVVVTIGDTGGGIPQAIRDKVFDPFFTTKAVGKGTGQGLAIAHRIIVEHHEGSIRFETEVGKGTRFVIRLPIQGPRKKQQEDASAVAA